MNYRFTLPSIAILGVIACLSSLPVHAAVAPYQTTAPVSFYADQGTVAPTIDGFIDAAEWRFSPQSSGASGSFWYVRWDPLVADEGIIQSGVISSPNNDEPFSLTDCSFVVYTLYDEEYLYIAVRVTDDFIEVNDAADGSDDGQTWDDDSVEIFIDGDLSRFDTPLTQASSADQTREFATGGQFVLTANNARRDNEAGNPTFGENGDWFARAEWTDTGYDVEFKIKLSKIGNPSKGSSIGFNVAVNDDDDGAAARYQLRWAGEPHLESSYGTLYFGPREIVAPMVDGPIVIDGVMDESDWASAAVEEVGIYSGVIVESIYPNSEDNLSFRASIMHDATWLYVGVVVTDDFVVADSEPEGSHNGNTWHDDSIEVFIDQDLNHGADTSNNRYGSADLIEGQFVLTAGNATRDSNTTNVPFIGNSDDDDWYAWATTNGNTWTGEMRFKKETVIGEGPVGFNMAVNDDDPGGSEPDFQLRWQGSPHVESSYGVLILGEAGTIVPEWMVH